MAAYIECASLLFAFGASEGVDGCSDDDVFESDGLEEGLPACTRQATGDSTSPQVDFPAHLLRHVDAVGNVRELQDASRPQYPPNLL